MGSPRSSSPQGFHETPLVSFSALATAGAGVGMAHLLSALVEGDWSLTPGESYLLVGLLLLGLVVSTGHLGRPLRAPLAGAGLGRSPLSNEVATLGLALGLSLIHI